MGNSIEKEELTPEQLQKIVDEVGMSQAEVVQIFQKFK